MICRRSNNCLAVAAAFDPTSPLDPPSRYVKDDPGAPKRSRPATLDGAPPGVTFATPLPFAAAPSGPAVMAGVPPGSGPGPGVPGVAPPGPTPGAPGSAYTYATTMPPNARLPPMMPCGYELVTNARDNPPCNTLFIGNLGDRVSEAELRGLFSHQVGWGGAADWRHSTSNMTLSCLSIYLIQLLVPSPLQSICSLVSCSLSW